MKTEVIIQELNFKASRSGGPGGQNVNKTSSKIEASFNVKDSSALSEQEKDRLFSKLGSRITADGVLIIQVNESRSQHRNKAIAIDRILQLIEQGLKTQKVRKKTKIPKSEIEKRLKAKRNQAVKKQNRRAPEF